jgi:mRNA-degrading endonuclease RelE of RelBE toxin-antitoxin system
MSYQLEVDDRLKRIFEKLKKKDSIQTEILKRKIKEILKNPRIGKPLTVNMPRQWRVHIRHFVLTYEILENEKTVRLLDYEHHDKVYKK